MSFQECVSGVFCGGLVCRLGEVGGESGFVSSGSRVVERLRRRLCGPGIVGGGGLLVLCLALLQPCADHSLGVALCLAGRLGLCGGPCLGLLGAAGSWSRPLWLLVGTPSAFGPELAYRLRVAQPTLMDVPIFLIYFCVAVCVCVSRFCGLSALVGCWSSVSIRRIIYKYLNVCPFDCTAVAVSGKVERSLTGLTTPVGWLLSLQLTVLGRSAILVWSKILVALLCCHVAFWIVLWVWGFLSQGWVRSLTFSLCFCDRIFSFSPLTTIYTKMIPNKNTQNIKPK